MLRKTLVAQLESKKKQEDDDDTFREEDFELPSEELHKLIETETKKRSSTNIHSAYDRLSILDTIASPIRASVRNKQNGSKFSSSTVTYSPTKSNFTYPSSLNPYSAVGQPTQPLQLSRYQKSITKVENNVKNEIQLVKMCLADEDKTLTSFEKADFINVEEEGDVSTLAKPKLGSLEEKLEDLRHESIEKWCKKRGHVAAVDFTNKDKRLLRNWFRELDYDGSGEVNVHELQDPMLSAGILRTKEQVVRVLANIDKNNTEGIDFEEFLIALRGNKLADQSKVKMLQDFSQNEYDFDMTTLLNEERRKKLIHSVMVAVEKREKRIDAVLSKLNNPRTSKREKSKYLLELTKAEEICNKSRKLHEMYISSLNGVVQDKKEWEAQQEKESLLHPHHHQAFSEWE
jgi:Ca2+-binding EF-hand superfamily protein